MIAKITRGQDLPGLVRYLLGPGRANEHTNQRVIASCDTVDVRRGITLDKTEVATLGRRLDAPRADFGREISGGHVWHLSLTNRSDDQHLTDDQWADIARGAVAAMGFTEEASGKPPCRWAAVAHGPSGEGNEHVHLAVSLVREDGTAASIWRDRVIMSRYCAEVERTYGLLVVHHAPGVGLPGVTRAEQERATREGKAVPDRTRLARTVRAAAVASETEAEFVRRLRGFEVIARPRFAEGGQEQVTGYSVALRPVAGGDPLWFGGGKLAADLSLPRLREFWEASPQDTAVAVAEWRGTARRPAKARERIVADPGRWNVAAQAVEDTYQWLTTAPVEDPALWAGTAREAAGVLAAWSLRVEGDRPGPLAQAAEALARSAQTTPGGPPAQRSVVPAFRGVTGIVLQATVTRNNTGDWVSLLVQFGHLAGLVARVHEARADRFQAERLATQAVDGLGHVESTVARQGIDARLLGPSARTPATLSSTARAAEQAALARMRFGPRDSGVSR